MGNRIGRNMRSTEDEEQNYRYHKLNSTSVQSLPNKMQAGNSNKTKYYIGKIQKQIQTSDHKSDDKYKWINQVYFTPQSKFIVVFEMVKLFLIYLYFIEIPITIAFQKHRKQQDSERIFEEINIPAITLFIMGIVIKLKTAFYKEGVLICQQKSIIMNYLLYSFIFDFFSITSIIIYEFAQILNQSHSNPIKYRFIVLLFYLQLPQIVKIEKSLISSFDLNRRIKASIKLFLLLLKIFMVSNVAACGFFYISDIQCPDRQTLQLPNCWIDKLIINGNTIRQSDWILQYSYSLYWASTTMLTIGYGDITPLNQFQVIFTIITEFFSCIVFAFSINEIWSIIQEKNKKRMKIHQRMNIINVYMRDKNVSLDLKSRVNAYLSYFYHTKNLREKQLQSEIIGELTPSLRKWLYFESYGFIFKQHKFFQNFSSYFLETASAKIYEIGYFQEEYIYQPEEELDSYPLYYVQKGQLQKLVVLGNSYQNNVSLQFIQKGCILGLSQFIKQINYQCSVVAIRYTLLYTIKHQEWMKCLKSWDEDFQLFMMTKHKILHQNYTKKLKLFCKLCKSKGHESQACFDQQIKSNNQDLINKYLFKHKRTPFKRQNLKSAFGFRCYSKFNKSILLEDQFGRKSPKIKGFLSPKYNRQSHQEKIGIILQKKRIKDSEWSDSDSSNEEILGEIFLMTDKVQNYEIYFPSMNASVDLAKQKRRATLNQVFRL